MAEAGKPRPEDGNAGAQLKTHPLVEKLTQSGTEPTAVVALVGYIGPSKTDGNVRLYTGLDFQTYYEVPRASVLSEEAIDAEDDNSPTQVMLPADTKIDLVQTTKQTGAASYLAGSIAAGYLRAAALAGFTSPNFHPTLTIATECTLVATICACPVIPGGQVGEEAAMAIPPEGAQAGIYRTIFCTQWCGNTGLACGNNTVRFECPTAGPPCRTYMFPRTAACANTGHYPCLPQVFPSAWPCTPQGGFQPSWMCRSIVCM
jgi:hypothetical protein